MKRIYVLGPRGMLGEMVRRYFGASEEFEVISLDQRFDQNNLVDYFCRYDDELPAVFVNGVGAIPQKVRREEDFILPNILVPLELTRGLANHHLLIHPSTDCVFRGDLGSPYPIAKLPDASDAYGWSKLQAERILSTRPNTVILRTSIIGPSSGPASGLLQWFLSQPKGAKLSGYTNHLWNGITTLQWCEEVERIISFPESNTCNLMQFGWAGGCNKHEMLMMFREAFRPDICVNPVEHNEKVDRRLEVSTKVPDLKEQLNKLRFMVMST